jgi:hypothetical protein
MAGFRTFLSFCDMMLNTDWLGGPWRLPRESILFRTQLELRSEALWVHTCLRTCIASVQSFESCPKLKKKHTSIFFRPKLKKTYEHVFSTAIASFKIHRRLGILGIITQLQLAFKSWLSAGSQISLVMFTNLNTKGGIHSIFIHVYILSCMYHDT